jgi:hypothetical protein
MNDAADSKVHWSFWLISIIALIWNGLGVANYFVQMNPEMLEMYRESERVIIEGRPAWATAGFALAVFGGAIGGVLLLLKNATAFYLFIVSFVGTIVAIAYSLGLDIKFGAGEVAGIVVLPLAVAGFLTWYSTYAKRAGWIR